MQNLGIERVLTNDPGIGVARHVDTGYEIAKKFVGADLQVGPIILYSGRFDAKRRLNAKPAPAFCHCTGVEDARSTRSDDACRVPKGDGNGAISYI
jgi:hypothetical protein